MDATILKITDYLLLKSSHLQDIGLFHGKMGIAISLFAYAHQYKDRLIEEFAWELLQQVYDGVHTDMPIGLENGLCGIGYGATLLYKYNWVDCDLNSVLADIDEKIMERDPRRIMDFSLRSGVGGLPLYLALRQRVNGSIETFDKQYLKELGEKTSYEGSTAAETDLLNLLNAPSFGESEYIDKPIGIDGGSAYYVLKQSLIHD